MKGFFERLDDCAAAHDSMLCIGLDPDPDRMPKHLPRGAKGIVEFNRRIIEATRMHAAAYKPTAAFYEACGLAGIRALRDAVRAAGDVPVILDAKRGDIGNSSRQYARAAFAGMGAGAITLSPYMGEDSVSPFLEFKDRGAYLLCRTSNPGGADFQDLSLADGAPLYIAVARKAAEWHARYGNVGLVVGATAPSELARVRDAIGGEMSILLPGIGAQGGDPEKALPAGLGARPGSLLVNVSRGVLYVSRGEDFAEAAARAALELKTQLNRIRDRAK